MDKKVLLRREVRRLKAQFTEETLVHRSASVWNRIEAHPRFMQAATVLLYWSMPDEVCTHDFIRRWHGRKTIVLPIVDGNRLQLARFDGEQSLRLNTAMNIREPVYSSPLPMKSIELSIIPGMAFDRSNHRMGRGGGYYDRLLPLLDSCNIGVCFDFQLFDTIPHEEYDVPMDEVVSC